MDDEKIRELFQANADRMLELAGDLVTLRSYVHVLRVAVATLISPDDPAQSLAALEESRLEFLKLDPAARELAEVENMVSAVRLWKKSGGGHHRA